MGYNKDLDAKRKEILNDIKKNLAEVSEESNLLNREMFMALALLHRDKLSGKFEYINEKSHVSMQINMSKYGIVQMISEISESVFKDNYELISMLLAYSMVNDTIESQTGKRFREETKIDCNGKTQEEIDLMKEMFKKSPEELAKIKEQMNE
jgi:hypothetical protein